MSEYGFHPGCTEEFSELCALSTTGSLTPRERSRFESHLSQCAQCRELVSQYRSLIEHGLPQIAPQALPSRSADHDFSWDIGQAKVSLLSQLDASPSSTGRAARLLSNCVPASFLKAPGVINSIRHGTAVAALIFAIAGSYQFGVRSGKERAARMAPPLNALKQQIDALQLQKSQLEQLLTNSQNLLSAVQLREKLAEKRVKDLEAARADLQSQTRILTAKSQEQLSSVADLTVQRGSLEQRIRETQNELSRARQELRVSEEERRQALLRDSDLSRMQAQIASLSTELAESKAATERQDQYLASDRDIRDLMGARQLYIADVFDVDSHGANRKPFGRVFYTRGKSLIFYAFDLDQQPGYREAKAFQAWGEPAENQATPVSLGIFYMDNESNRRWALKFDNPKVLEEISSVFVTLEPKGGSKRPTNKPFLLAYLHTAPPNHP